MGLFDPESLGQGMKAVGLSAQEIVITLSHQIREGNSRDQREAIALLQKLAKDAVELSGNVATARIEQTAGDGTTHVLTAQKLINSLKIRPSLAEGQVVQTAPVDPRRVENVSAIKPVVEGENDG